MNNWLIYPVGFIVLLGSVMLAGRPVLGGRLQLPGPDSPRWQTGLYAMGVLFVLVLIVDAMEGGLGGIFSGHSLTFIAAGGVVCVLAGVGVGLLDLWMTFYERGGLSRVAGWVLNVVFDALDRLWWTFRHRRWPE